MDQLKTKLSGILEKTAQRHSLLCKTEWFDYFPSAVNHEVCNDMIRKAAVKNGFQLVEREEPFKFGEDFGWYTKQYPSAMFGLGAGTNVPALHSDEYDFPDELIDTGIRMFSGIIGELLG